MKMLIRSFKLTDTEQCVELIKCVWDFDGFSSSIGSNATAMWYFAHHLLPSTHTFILEEEGKVLGYLFATIPNCTALQDQEELQQLNRLIEEQWNRTTSEDERSQFLKDWFYGGNWAEEVLEQQQIQSKASMWLQLFVVSPNAQGKGIGTRLLKAFETVAKKTSYHWLLLRTDTWCGWQFYEKRGFLRLGACPVVELPVQEDGVQPAYYLYGKRSDNQ